ncbi:MAG: hypothetical protein WBH03_21345, partial [Cyclobacteriaceae bacterium]
EFVRAIGKKAVFGLNALARKGGVAAVRAHLGLAGSGAPLAFAKGGVLDGIGDALGKGRDLLGGVGSFLRSPLGFLKDLFARGVGVLRGNPFFDFAKGAAGKLAAGVKDKVFGLFGGGGGPGSAYKGVGGLTSALISAVVKAIVPGARMTSGFRAGARTLSGYISGHSENPPYGRAADFVSSNMLRDFLKVRDIRAWREAYFTPAGPGGSRRYGRPHTLSGVTAASHYDHFHLRASEGEVVDPRMLTPTLYDTGGPLPPGDTWVRNRTGGTEWVSPRKPEDRLPVQRHYHQHGTAEELWQLVQTREADEMALLEAEPA